MKHFDTYSLSCENGHEVILDPTELEDYIYDDHECSECGSPMELQENECYLECHICSMPYYIESLDEAFFAMEAGCGKCGEFGFGSSLHFPGSFGDRSDVRSWISPSKEPKGLLRTGRLDYWEGLIHFCNADEFASIFRQRVILANPTGYFNVPAVCFTDAPIGNWTELKATHGQFGYVFRKRQIIDAGGGSVSYLSDLALKGQWNSTPEQLKPFFNVVRPRMTNGKGRHDFLHEREWRLPKDLNIDAIVPYAVILGKVTPTTPDWQAIFDASCCFEELAVG